MQLDVTFRTVKSNIQIIRVFNPPPKDHWIIKNFYDLQPVQIFDHETGEEIEGYFNGIPKGRSDHLSIFATYKDNFDFNNESSRRNYEKFKITNPEYYYNQIRGLITGGAKGVIFKFNKHWYLYKDLPDIPFHVVYSLDFGGGGSENDKPDGKSKTVFGKLYINKDLKQCFVKILLYKGYISSNELYDFVKKETVKTDSEGYTTKKKVMVDNARKDKVRDMLNEKIYVLGAKTKEGGSNQIVTGYEIMKKYEIYIHVDDKHAQTELNSHKWEVNKLTKELTGNVEDKFKDVLDMIRYALVNYDLYNN
jgi:phage terminase large subunit